MMILEAGEICPYKNRCPHNNSSYMGMCHGARSDRKNRFECEFVNNGQILTNNCHRNSLDQTGKMRVIME